MQQALLTQGFVVLATHACPFHFQLLEPSTPPVPDPALSGPPAHPAANLGNITLSGAVVAKPSQR